MPGATALRAISAPPPASRWPALCGCTGRSRTELHAMYRLLRNAWRLIRIARTLARHDALFPFERAGVAPFLVRVAKTLWKRDQPGRPGQRLAAALEA